MTDEKRKDEVVKEEDREVVKDKDSKPQSELYEDVEGYEEETNIEVPTEEAVEKAKEWSEEKQL